MTQLAERSFYTLQSELIKTKVDMVVNQSIKEVVQQIVELRQEVRQGIGGLRQEMQKEIGGLRQEMQKEIGSLRQEMQKEIGGLRQEIHREVGGLRQEMHKEMSGLKNEMNNRFSGLEVDMAAVKTRLGMRDKTTNQMRSHFLDYSFKLGWIFLLAGLSGIVSFFALRIPL